MQIDLQTSSSETISAKLLLAAKNSEIPKKTWLNSEFLAASKILADVVADDDVCNSICIPPVHSEFRTCVKFKKIWKFSVRTRAYGKRVTGKQP